MCALFSPEILRAGAVKGLLTWGNVFRRRGCEPFLAQKLMVHVMDLRFSSHPAEYTFGPRPPELHWGAKPPANDRVCIIAVLPTAPCALNYHALSNCTWTTLAMLKD